MIPTVAPSAAPKGLRGRVLPWTVVSGLTHLKSATFPPPSREEVGPIWRDTLGTQNLALGQGLVRTEQMKEQNLCHRVRAHYHRICDWGGHLV